MLEYPRVGSLISSMMLRLYDRCRACTVSACETAMRPRCIMPIPMAGTVRVRTRMTRERTTRRVARPLNEDIRSRGTLVTPSRVTCRHLSRPTLSTPLLPMYSVWDHLRARRLRHHLCNLPCSTTLPHRCNTRNTLAVPCRWPPASLLVTFLLRSPGSILLRRATLPSRPSCEVPPCRLLALVRPWAARYYRCLPLSLKNQRLHPARPWNARELLTQ